MHLFLHGKATVPPHDRIHICSSPPPVEGESEVEIEVEGEKLTCQAVKEEVDA